MIKKESSYLDIFKSTSLFGSLQLFTIIISVIRSKFVAVLLGPTGMGLNGLLSSTTSLIIAFANLGISRSAVKNIAAASKDNEKGYLTTVVSSLLLFTWVTGIISTVLTFLFSEFLSKVTFGTVDYSFAFKWIAISILLNQLATSYESVLRGMHQVKLIASATLKGSISGLLISIPLYYIYGIKGIVPSIVVSSLTLCVINLFYYKKLGLRTSLTDRAAIIVHGKDMFRMGIILSISSVMLLAESYYVRIFIRSYGTMEDVGFFNAGIAIVNTYFGLFFASITTDYYPKLAAIANDNVKAVKLMGQQSEMTVLIIAPFLVIFIVFIQPIIIILYSKEFLPLIELVLWAGLGIFFKTASYALGVIFISKGDVKTLFWSELLSIIVLFALNILGYWYYGLEGLGISFMLSNVYVYIQNYVLVKYKYSFSYSKSFLKIFLIMLFFGLVSLLLVKFFQPLYIYLLGSITIIITLYYSLNELNQRMGLFNFFRNYFNKKNDE